MGNYSGLASLNLSNQLSYPGRRSEISIQKDAMTMSERPDFLHFVKDLRRHDQFADKANLEALLGRAKDFAENKYSNEKSHHLQGATYLKIQDAFELDKKMRTSASRNIKIYKKTSSEFEIRSFLPRWPQRLLPVMAAGSHYDPPSPFCFGAKYRKGPIFFWLLTNMCHYLPAMWESLDDTVMSKRS
jgi:hypothetical protein